MIFFFEHHGMDTEDFFSVRQFRDQSFPAHIHRAYELIFVNSGTLSLHVDKKRYLLAEGDIAFVFSSQIHSFSASEKADIIVVLFSPEIIYDFHSAHKDSVPENNVIRLETPQDLHNLKSVYAHKSLLYHMCDRLLSATGLESVGNRSQTAVLQQIFVYVNKHLGEDCSLKTVSLSMQYDYAYLSRLFTRLTGMHFNEYLNKCRIAQACYLLKAGSRSVSEIASCCGYSTLRTFHRNFQKVIGCSPKEYSQRT